MFDPASFFGHSEFELAIMDMFGGFQEAFWTSYHAKVGCARDFAERGYFDRVPPSSTAFPQDCFCRISALCNV